MEFEGCFHGCWIVHFRVFMERKIRLVFGVCESRTTDGTIMLLIQISCTWIRFLMRCHKKRYSFCIRKGLLKAFWDIEMRAHNKDPIK